MKPNQNDSSFDKLASADSGGTDIDVEVELLKNNPEFMTLMNQLSQEKPAISLKDLRKELEL